MSYTIKVSGGDIYVDGRNLGDSAVLESFQQGTIIANVPPAGQSFISWLGDTDYISDPNIAAPSFSFTSGGEPRDLVISANFDTSPPAQTVYDEINDKLDIIDANIDDLLDPLT
jgi:hypothetical protein